MATTDEIEDQFGGLQEVSDGDSSDWEVDNQPVQHSATKSEKAKTTVQPKGVEEEELERFILGDKAGFRARLFDTDTIDDVDELLQAATLAQSGADLEVADVMEDANDTNLFFYEQDQDPSTALAISEQTKALFGAPGQKQANVDAPAWEDSDDERLQVSLVKTPHLRKLRQTMDEDVISGAEYARRLRQRYTQLNPTPEWVIYAQKTAQKRKSSHAMAEESSDEDKSSNDDSDDDSDEDGDITETALPLDQFFRNASNVVGASAINGRRTKKRRLLRPEVLDIQKTREIPTGHRGEVSSLAFHPKYAVLLSSSTSAVLHLHQIAPAAHPTPNPLLTSVRVKRTAIQRAAFIGDSGDEIVFAGRRSFFHTWNLATGKVQRVSRILGRHRKEHKSMERFRVSPGGDHIAIIGTVRKGGGMLNVLNVQTMQWEAQPWLDSQGGIADFQWWRNGEGITILGRDGQVGEWSLEMRRFVAVWRDDGSIGGTVMALGGAGGPDQLGGDRWLALGSKSGIVNIYERASLIETDAKKLAERMVFTSNEGDGDEAGRVVVKELPTPTRTFEQLTKPVTQVLFSPDGQLLAFATKHTRDALKLAHLPSCTVYRNWPTNSTPLGQITAVAFSKDSDMLAVGNLQGKTRLWEIRS